ncbi:C-C chemokine receptor type 8 [Corythoichthys intestinalis]|uniref:C-C chemokine receptor type 8 n=1 Tax=Corythoichthys intestinalis TaxID=161448 RepID=UPI0025A62378|nr:C-C chemokine receptor type 8 [Corythoichthys intestinalis]XP_057690585.1 C-C chemokine receptor type 8 [Corythoichthys intestinalis]XP_061789546.1 C-C chemokine receptor type 8-like [Nerophis lumbriciformis]
MANISSVLSVTSENLLTGELTRPSSTAFPENTTFDSEIYGDYGEYLDDGDYGEYGSCVYERHGASFLPGIYCTFFLLGFVGNSLVVWVIVCGVQLRNMTDVCLLNLAVADLLLVGCLPFLAYQSRDQWIFGDTMCKVLLGIYRIVFYSSIFFITVMSIDRYLAIVQAVYAMRARTRSFGIFAASVTWATGFLASFPELIYLKQQPGPMNSTVCYPVYSTDTDHHFWWVFGLFKMNILGMLIPIVIMSFCYSQIIRRLLSSQSSKRQTIYLVVTVVAVFFLCWVPYNVVSFFQALELLHVYTKCNSSKVIRLAGQITEVIAYLHSCLNPVLYVFVGQKFRRNLLRLINRTPCGLCQRLKVLIPQQQLSRFNISQTSSLDERSTAV